MTDANEAVQSMGLDSERERSLRGVGVLSYLLHGVVAVGAVVPGVQASVFLLLVAVLIDLIKRDEARGSWQATHFSWRLRSVLWAGALYVLTSPLFLLFFVPGWIAWALVSLWFLYRIVRGWTAMNAGRAMP
ncbi:hypothetical protein LNV09_21130 [Paucibacter sp. B2R-40]|uniref:DUF4870 family protein n=1 Tax=Paucibacter sp. B2R-40 TaxID=2893554 RepID=UPI0021E50F29|nr:hypothetical protein [Paucibacter sp. B2R-40]MCV2356651.1 hypothetical protein [Paucibacter sp. B2R-40]